MISLSRLALLLSDIAPRIEDIQGRFFLDRREIGRDALLAEIHKYPDHETAQRWINMVPIDDLIDAAVEDWEIDDSMLEKIAAVYARSWLAIIKSTYGDQAGLSVELLRDSDSGDVIVRLNQV